MGGCCNVLFRRSGRGVLRGTSKWAGGIEVGENNSDTGGASRYFSIDKAGRAEEFVVEYPGFDCRTRPWYKAALDSRKATFSRVYRHFVFNDLAITASLPVYRENKELIGVFGADYLLGSINAFLRENRVVEGMIIFIVEDETDYLIANSELLANFLLDDQGDVKRLRPDETGNAMLTRAYLSSVSEGMDKPVRKDGNFIEHSRVEKENLKWNIYISIPEEPFLAGFRRIGRITISIITLFILLTTFLALYLSRAVTGSILKLSNAAEAFVKDRWSSRAPVVGNNEITRLSLAFNTMAEELQGLLDNLEEKVAERTAELNELNKTKDTFFAIIAHDLRGPLSSSYRMLDHLLEEHQTYKPEELEMVIKTIGDSQKSIYGLLENLLLWAQNQRNEVSFSPGTFSVDELVQEVLFIFQGNAVEKELDIHYESSGRFIRCDRNMIITVIRNLLSNAVKFSPRGGKIDILCRQAEGEIELSVRDYGKGMDEGIVECLQKIGNRDSTPGTEGEKGTGWGLVITGDFLARHKSKLKVYSQKGKGSCFSFRLPTRDVSRDKNM